MHSSTQGGDLFAVFLRVGRIVRRIHASQMAYIRTGGPRIVQSLLKHHDAALRRAKWRLNLKAGSNLGDTNQNWQHIWTGKIMGLQIIVSSLFKNR